MNVLDGDQGFGGYLENGDLGLDCLWARMGICVVCGQWKHLLANKCSWRYYSGQVGWGQVHDEFITKSVLLGLIN